MRNGRRSTGVALLSGRPKTRYASGVTRRFGTGLVLVAAFAFGGGEAWADAPPAPLRLELPAPPTFQPVFPSERLTLWPVAPLRFSFSEVRPVAAATWNGPTNLFRAESVWFETGALTLRTIGEKVEALGLDCQALRCAPETETSIAIEARVAIGGTGVVPDNYIYGRYKQVSGLGGGFSKPGAGIASFGIGGVLDL